MTGGEWVKESIVKFTYTFSSSPLLQFFFLPVFIFQSYNYGHRELKFDGVEARVRSKISWCTREEEPHKHKCHIAIIKEVTWFQHIQTKNSKLVLLLGTSLHLPFLFHTFSYLYSCLYS